MTEYTGTLLSQTEDGTLVPTTQGEPLFVNPKDNLGVQHAMEAVLKGFNVAHQVVEPEISLMELPSSRIACISCDEDFTPTDNQRRVCDGCIVFGVEEESFEDKGFSSIDEMVDAMVTRDQEVGNLLTACRAVGWVV
jgi:hypothetical protein